MTYATRTSYGSGWCHVRTRCGDGWEPVRRGAAPAPAPAPAPASAGDAGPRGRRRLNVPEEIADLWLHRGVVAFFINPQSTPNLATLSHCTQISAINFPPLCRGASLATPNLSNHPPTYPSTHLSSTSISASSLSLSLSLSVSVFLFLALST